MTTTIPRRTKKKETTGPNKGNRLAVANARRAGNAAGGKKMEKKNASTGLARVQCRPMRLRRSTFLVRARADFCLFLFWKIKRKKKNKNALWLLCLPSGDAPIATTGTLFFSRLNLAAGARYSFFPLFSFCFRKKCFFLAWRHRAPRFERTPPTIWEKDDRPPSLCVGVVNHKGRARNGRPPWVPRQQYNFFANKQQLAW